MKFPLALLLCTLGCAAAALLPSPSRVLDAHVHLTNNTFLQYSWANASAGVCPCAPPCECTWAVSDWRAASSTRPANGFVFVEVDAIDADWLKEVSWVDSLSRDPSTGPLVSAMVAHPPPGFGTSAASNQSIADALDSMLAQYPIVHGLRPWVVYNDSSQAASLTAHIRIAADRGLSIDVMAIVGDADVLAGIVALVESAPDCTFILNHCGSPPVTGDAASIQAWQDALNVLAAFPNVWVKWGGLLQYWKAAERIPAVSEIVPFAAATLNAFGWQRVIWEGNWFFCNFLVPSNLNMYALWIEAALATLASASPTQADIDNLFYRNGALAYRVRS